LLKRVRLRSLVQLMQEDLGIKLAFAETPFSDSPKNTYEELLNELNAIPPTERTKREVSLIQTFDELSKRHPKFPMDILFAKEECLDLNMPKSVLTSRDKVNLIKTICALDKRYSVSKANTIYIFSDKDSMVNTDRISLKFADVSLNEAAVQLIKLLSDKGIELNGFPQPRGSRSGMTNNAERYWPWWMPWYGGAPRKEDNPGINFDKKITLILDNVPLAEAFSRFAEAVGPNVTWQLLESSKYKYLSFGEIRETDCWNSTIDNYR
jgi:hypothetical protein